MVILSGVVNSFCSNKALTSAEFALIPGRAWVRICKYTFVKDASANSLNCHQRSSSLTISSRFLRILTCVSCAATPYISPNMMMAALQFLLKSLFNHFSPKKTAGDDLPAATFCLAMAAYTFIAVLLTASSSSWIRPTIFSSSILAPCSTIFPNASMIDKRIR